jgi:ribonuclease HI
MPDQPPHIEIYTDGGCSPNPGPGGWGAILIHPKKTRELSGGHPDTTNNRMELTAAVEALKALTVPCKIDFHTDSQYLRKGITQWISGWAANGWRSTQTGQRKPIANVDLWQELHALTHQHAIEWHWVKGHAGNEFNERADKLASAAIPHPEQHVDLDATRVYLRISGKQTRGPFGWAASVIRGNDTEIIQGSHPNSTVNHFALCAAAEVLEQISQDEPVQFFTNNSYLYDGITNWVKNWRRGGWTKPENFRSDWQKLDQIDRNRQIQWVRFREDIPDEFKTLKSYAEEARNQADSSST